MLGAMETGKRRTPLRTPRRRFIARAAALCFLAFVAHATPVEAASPTRFQLADVWEVESILVETESASASASRELAFGRAGRAALSRLVAKLVPTAAAGSLPPVPDSVLTTWIESLQVEEERFSATAYSARFRVVFRPEQVRLFLESHGIPWTEARSRPLLVLPIFTRNGSRPVLWKEGLNPWLSWWRARDAAVELVPLALPLGDAEDSFRISATDALAGDARALFAVASRYRARGVVVAHMDLLEEGDRSTARLLLHTQRYELGRSPESTFDVFYTTGAEDLSASFARAVLGFNGPLQEEWKRLNLVGAGLPAEVLAEFRMSGAAAWGSLRQRLDDLPSSLQTEVVGFRGARALVRLRSPGGEERLGEELLRAGLRLRALRNADASGAELAEDIPSHGLTLLDPSAFGAEER